MTRLVARTPIRKNLVSSVLFGPFRMGVPAVLSLILFPAILNAGGLELLGVWASYLLILLVTSLFDFGFGSFVERQVAKGREGEEADRQIFQVVWAVTFTIAIAIVPLAFFLIDAFLASLALPYTADIKTAFIVVCMAGAVSLPANLWQARLAGLNKYYLVQKIVVISNLIRFAFAFAALATSRIELCLAFAIFLERIALALMLLNALRGLWTVHNPRPASESSLAVVIVKAMQKLKGFVLMHAAVSIRRPLVRAVIGLSGGATALAVFELVDRIPSAVFQFCPASLRPVYAATASLYAANEWPKIVKVYQFSLFFIVFGINFLLSLYILNADIILEAWVGAQSDTVILATSVLALWWALASIHSPFHFANLAMGGETSESLFMMVQSLLFGLGGLWVIRESHVNIDKIIIWFAAAGTVAVGLSILYCMSRWRGMRNIFVGRFGIAILVGAILLPAIAVVGRSLIEPNLAGDASLRISLHGIMLLSWLALAWFATDGEPHTIIRELRK